MGWLGEFKRRIFSEPPLQTEGSRSQLDIRDPKSFITLSQDWDERQAQIWIDYQGERRLLIDFSFDDFVQIIDSYEHHRRSSLRPIQCWEGPREWWGCKYELEYASQIGDVALVRATTKMTLGYSRGLLSIGRATLPDIESITKRRLFYKGAILKEGEFYFSGEKVKGRKILVISQGGELVIFENGQERRIRAENGLPLPVPEVISEDGETMVGVREMRKIEKGDGGERLEEAAEAVVLIKGSRIEEFRVPADEVMYRRLLYETGRTWRVNTSKKGETVCWRTNTKFYLYHKGKIILLDGKELGVNFGGNPDLADTGKIFNIQIGSQYGPHYLSVNQRGKIKKWSKW